jgi:hypothetical protein
MNPKHHMHMKRCFGIAASILKLWIGLFCWLSIVLAMQQPKKKFRKIQEIENRKTCFVRGCCSKEGHTIVAWLVGVTDLDARMG